ncbi:arrestin domain-containing protein 17-like [Ruditapes philippinarum]|uniref:arrestin domain-containing protein 17-like n=1 Tax=Ruditapes philippinarum TaxID=129788 RepID=UPI00295BAC0B|nr:arrestin domain-containing protein 17-like [Ruditapes philippinarum]XP_060551926.1 arrestin domain-containing protein 17-like [Ruditapes philippinarum]XP_060571227.1 arrestin domain-containing protein 17-like [Ruditapes philippinarum]
MAVAKQSPFESVTINLEHDIDEQYQYQPGEIIRGKIVIHLHRSTLVESVYLTITGEGICAWEEEYVGALESKEIYIDASQAIFDAEGLARYLEKGFHQFPFEYRLPDNVPSSFIGKFGSVTYILKAIVQGERQGDTTIATEPFLVMRKYLLPDELSEPLKTKLAKTYFSMCSWGKVNADIHLNRTGFVPGEDICLQAEVQNHSPLRITAIQAGLLMESTYRAQKNIIAYKQIVNKRRDDYELIDGDGRRWQNVRIGIPAYVPESFLEGCDIIDLSYKFQFRIELSSGKELKTEIPITVGANPRGLELPGPERKDDVNIHWTMGPRDLAKQQMEEQREMSAWTIASPEFRDREQVMNPLFRNESEKLSNGDRPHVGNAHNEDSYDEIAPDYPGSKEDTRL